MIGSFTYEVRGGGKVIFPGSVGEGAGRAGWRRAAFFRIRMLLSAGTLQRYSFIFSSVAPRLTRPRRTGGDKGKIRLLSWFTGLLALNTSYSVFLAALHLENMTSEKYPWFLCSKNKARHDYLSWCMAVMLHRALLTFISALNPRKPWLPSIFLYLHGYDLLGPNSTSSFHLFILNLSPAFFCLSSWQPTLPRVTV